MKLGLLLFFVFISTLGVCEERFFAEDEAKKQKILLDKLDIIQKKIDTMNEYQEKLVNLVERVLVIAEELEPTSFNYFTGLPNPKTP